MSTRSFSRPDDGLPLYFEYEISPLGFELPILVSNNHGTFMGWLPWYYLNDRKIRKATAATGGPKQAGATVEGWTAEFFIPYLLFKGINGVPPGPARAGAPTSTAWTTTTAIRRSGTGRRWVESFHEYRGFGVLLFD